MSERRVSLLIDASRRDWEQQLTQTLADATKNTHLMIFIVGHAYLGDDDRGYLAATDFDSTKMAQTGLLLDWLIEKMDACPAPEKLLVLDVTPLATGKDADQQVAGKTLSSKLKSPPKSTQIIVSCDDGQKSREWKDKQHGLFPWTVAEGIKGAADVNRDLRLTPNELFTTSLNRRNSPRNESSTNKPPS